MFVSTENTSCHKFTSQFGLAIFLYAKNTQKPRGNRVASASVYLNDPAIGHWSPAELAKRAVNYATVGPHRPIEQRQPERRRRCVCVCVRVCVCARACVRARVRACVCVCVLCDDNI